MRVYCGIRWGPCVRFINISERGWDLGQFEGPLIGVYGHVYSIRPVQSVWPVHIHTLAGAWFIRTRIAPLSAVKKRRRPVCFGFYQQPTSHCERTILVLPPYQPIANTNLQ